MYPASEKYKCDKRAHIDQQILQIQQTSKQRKYEIAEQDVYPNDIIEKVMGEGLETVDGADTLFARQLIEFVDPNQKLQRQIAIVDWTPIR